MASARHALLLLAAATMAALAVVSSGVATASELMMSPSTIHARMAAELAASSDDESCWGSPEECPVVYYHDDADDEAGGAGATRGRMRLRLYEDANTTASLLPTAQYLSYGVLMPDSVPCSVPGASYYNCKPGAEANPYSRGCSAITQCRD